MTIRAVRTGLTAALLAAVLVAGCGGPITNDELGRGIASLGSAASEGALVADGVARNRSKNTFVRVQSRTLADDVDHEAEKLVDAETRPGNVKQRDEAVKLAGQISSVLGDLATTPGDEKAGRDARRALQKLSQDAERLGETL